MVASRSGTPAATPPRRTDVPGLATISFYADDLANASEWYTELLGLPPYYAFPPAPAEAAYIEFRVGDDEDEFGFIDRRYAPAGAANSPGGAVMYWHVDDLPATAERLLSMGATEYEPITPRSAGLTTASFVDPFGNVLGIMHNPHYLGIVESRAQREG
ncbi:VOC family protein [Pseudactinotalea sp. Z1739]|uniref:VOC family protein n=1 Tax=Pseudactinotalea sp. Z1739 TaxID=3413028 RepID=UPI003C7B5988